jgi:hypothetical protein
MSDFEELATHEALRAALGKGVRFWRHGRDLATPMNFVLDEVERQIGPQFSIFWVQDCSEVFCLPGFRPSPIIFSPRYIILTALVNRLYVDDWLKDHVLVEVTERTCLKLIADVALRHVEPDLAARALLKSFIGEGVRIEGATSYVAKEKGAIRRARHWTI